MQSNNYWSSSTSAFSTSYAWFVYMDFGYVYVGGKVGNLNYVWPVRAGEWEHPLFSLENLHRCYLACRRNKRDTMNALRFEINGEEELFALSLELSKGTYYPLRTVCFLLTRPKMREIIAADFRDRVVHHVLVEHLEAIYEPLFIYDSHACRRGKGIHHAVARIKAFIRKGSKNGRIKLFFLHLDIKNFFMTIRKDILYTILQRRVKDETMLNLARTVIFHNPAANCVVRGGENTLRHLPAHKSLFHAPENRGLPVGNLTSQFFANLYLNELDQFVKHVLKCAYYVRYCDDFIILDASQERLEMVKERIREFVETRLSLSLNEKFDVVRPVSSGMDFLGYIIRPDYTLVRRRVVSALKARLREFRRVLVAERDGMRIYRYDVKILERLMAVLASYLGHFRWADAYRLRTAILEGNAFLSLYFSFEEGRIAPKFRHNRDFASTRAQYVYYAAKFAPSVVLFQVGCYYEFYREIPSPAREILHLNRVKDNKRGVRYGFHVRRESLYVKRLINGGLTVMIVRETDRMLGRKKERLPWCVMEPIVNEVIRTGGTSNG